MINPVNQTNKSSSQMVNPFDQRAYPGGPLAGQLVNPAGKVATSYWKLVNHAGQIDNPGDLIIKTACLIVNDASQIANPIGQSFRSNGQSCKPHSGSCHPSKPSNPAQQPILLAKKSIS